jgi:iron complex outermembrane receptor protein
MLILKIGSETRFDDNTKLKLSLNNELGIVNSNNYSQRKGRNTSSLTASLERECNNRLGATFLLREILTQNNLLIPDYSAGLQFRIAESKDTYLKANVSRNSRIPTMNDLYYQPWGNQDLKNEYADIYEVTYEMNHSFSRSFKIKSELSLYRNLIKDMILWHIEGNNLSVDNINRVKTTGLEENISMTYSVNKILVQLNGAYSFTKATTVVSYLNEDVAIGKQLMYVPEHQVNSSLRFYYRSFYSSWELNMTSNRYTTSSNTVFLPGYLLNNLITGLKIPFHKTAIDLNFSINNLFDVNYQSIVLYPMPGRSYTVKFLFQLYK